MSDARGNSRRGQGQRPGSEQRPANSAGNPAGNPSGYSPYARKEKDDLRSKIMKAKSRYEDLCDVVDGQRFRVRAEILDNSEDYITVQMGCNLPGVVTLPWAEYSSADLEIRYGSSLDLARKVKMMIRRSVERLAITLDVQSALQLRGTDAEKRLLMSSKEWKSLKERQPVQPVQPTRSVAGPLYAGGPPATGGPGYYANASAAASEEMNRRFLQLFPGDQGPARNWADSEVSSVPESSAPVPPPSQQRGTSTSSEVAHGRVSSASSVLNPGGGIPPPHIPAPKGAGPGFVPAPTTSRG
jgi:hypothetical protein